MGQALTKNKKDNYGRVQKFQTKDEYLTINGGILLEKQIALSRCQDVGAGQLIILSEDALRSATNNYDPHLVVRRNRRCTVYKATLDDRIVAVTTTQDCQANPELTDFCLTHVSIGMVMCHINMVKIYGCCLETCVPIMVYEFYPNKDLHQYLHGDMALQKPLKWNDRLTAAIDIAYALSYMHNALSKTVVHRDVKSLGMLFDESFHVKLGNLGFSVCVTPGKKDQIWPVHGTPGYIDPEYIETQEVTDKCDVYSFGVLMLELLTGKDPVEMVRCGKDLVNEFVSSVERNGVIEMIDGNLIEEDSVDEIQRFVRLAVTCVAKKGEERPTMISVVEELWHIQNNGRERRGSTG